VHPLLSISTPTPVRIALLDLYDGEPNQGMRALRELLAAAEAATPGVTFQLDAFDVRAKDEVPDLRYDLYVSSGGPGSPFDGEGTAWELDYFRWMERVWNYNANAPDRPKHVLCICHSFQMMCRLFDVAEVTRRRSPSLGIYPVHKTEAGMREPLFDDLPDPFFAADFRRWQAVEARRDHLQDLGAAILAREKKRPHVDLERAIMGIRISPEIVGVQFHPEADPPGMRVHFRKPPQRVTLVDKIGERKYERLLHRLDDPTYLMPTYRRVIPHFLRDAIRAARPEESASVDG
jgi:GMP synthase-like glutamine amidotransferase